MIPFLQGCKIDMFLQMSKTLKNFGFVLSMDEQSQISSLSTLPTLRW